MTSLPGRARAPALPPAAALALLLALLPPPARAAGPSGPRPPPPGGGPFRPGGRKPRPPRADAVPLRPRPGGLAAPTRLHRGGAPPGPARVPVRGARPALPRRGR